MNASNFYTWQAIAMQLAPHPWGTTLRIEKYRVEHPRDAGMKPSTGLPVGQRGGSAIQPAAGCMSAISATTTRRTSTA